MRRLILLLLTQLLIAANLAIAAVNFDGTGDAETTANPDKGHASAFSVCFWLKTASYQDTAALWSYGNGNNSSAGRGFEIVTRTGGIIRARYYAGATAQNLDTSTAQSTAAWHGYCLTHSASADKWYIDSSTADFSDNLDNPTVQDSTDDFLTAVTIPDQASPRISLNGELAHLAYWQGVELTSSEVGSILDKTTCPTAVQAASLQYFIKMDSAGSVTDSSANAFTVTESGNPTTSTGPVGLPCGAAATNHLFLIATGQD